MSNLTYNPNINMEFDNGGGNFRNNNSYDTPQILQQMDPRVPMENMRQPVSQPMMQQMQPMMEMRPQTRPQMRQNYENYDYDMPTVRRKKNRVNYNDEPIMMDKFEDSKSTKFDWMLFVKKLVIYTALFLIMSHVKMDELVCKFIPFLSDNQILCMTTKGLLLALIIILIQTIL